MKSLPNLVSAALLAGTSFAAQGALNGVNLGVNPPPLMLGGFGLTPAVADIRAIPGTVMDLTLIPGISLAFDQALAHTRVGADWSSWSLGYDGDVYYTTLSSDPYSLTLDLGAGVPAIYFYAQPDAFDMVDITAEAGDGVGTAMLTQNVDGFGGAAGFGFYGDSGSLVRTIKITIDPASGAGGFAVGQFGTVPEAGTSLAVGVMSLGAALLAWRRFRR